MAAHDGTPWLEVGDRVYVRRYRFFDQVIGLVLGDGAAVVIDTRTTPSHARELQAEIRALTDLPIDAVINTHAHSDHCFGNAMFDPVRIWGQRGAVRWLAETGERQREGLRTAIPDLADDLAGVVLRAPDSLVDAAAIVDVGGRMLELAFHGRAHTDHDLVVGVPDAGVVFAGDIIEEGNAPYFGDGFPVAWPETLAAFLAAHPQPVVVPGHGAVVDRAFVDRQRADVARLAAAARQVAAGTMTADELVAAVPFPEPTAREALSRALLELGDLADR